ncbi:hypothetical protein QJS04_geneDACA014277 [Acorus gramineus]|uniref:Uncharacterized protein n=1 Tax=Acorus gramineus TaxID=55184 RepID=A0AAV9BW91_ACOGR|nr:hypothetical protein QJS04_geneDACA014277 [Acorus gramineus]
MRATENSISSSSDSSPRRPTRKISLREKKKKRARKSKKRRSVSSCSSSSSSSPCRSRRRRRSRSPRRHGTKSSAGKDKRRRKRGRSPVRSSRSSSSCSTCRGDSESVERRPRKKSKRGAEEKRRLRGRSWSRRGGSRSCSGSTSSSSRSRGYSEEKLLRKRSDSRRGGSRSQRSEERQKALENFKKFRDSAKSQVMKGDENDENNDAKRVISKPISKTISIRSEIVRVSHDVIDSSANPSVNSTSVGGSVRLSEEGCNLKEPKPVQESSNNVLLEGVTNEKVINKQGSSGGGDARVAKADGRASPPPNGAAICNNPVMSGEQQKVETKDGSEFQQKTMSVMRGGEAVQVSYKVYIPKKAPALARRQLQR